MRTQHTRSKLNADEPSYSITDARPLIFVTLLCLLAFKFIPPSVNHLALKLPTVYADRMLAYWNGYRRDLREIAWSQRLGLEAASLERLTSLQLRFESSQVSALVVMDSLQHCVNLETFFPEFKQSVLYEEQYWILVPWKAGKWYPSDLYDAAQALIATLRNSASRDTRYIG